MKKLFAIVIIFVLTIAGSAQEYQAGDHEMFLMPTAMTMPEGNSYLTDYELVLLNYTYAVTSTTHIGVFSLFPIVPEFLETITLGAKQNYYQSEKLNAAVWATYTPKASGLTLGGVFSFGPASNGFHVAISTMKGLEEDSNSWEMVYMLGYRYDVSQKVSLMAEYTNLSTGIDEGFNGLISIGVRFRGESISWDLAGLRPLEKTEGFLFAPLLKATFMF
ncbi:MAG: hypothetical protein E4H13_09160 [Calditrichales bacterium]|nr:MAG: hypothetical protein E4H13_09160 [Calditrichales bacterium]